MVWFYAPQWLAPESDSQLSQNMEAQDKSASSELSHDDIASTRKAIAQDGEQTQVDKSAESLISPYIKQSHNPINAMQTLFGLWGYQVEVTDANCRQALRADLYCYQGTGDLGQLAVINRPAMLTLRANYQTYFVILYRINESSSQLLLADKRIEVPNEWLKKHWNGEYQLLWHSKMADQVLKINDTRGG